MKRLRTLIGVASVLCIVAIIVAPASASLQNMGEAPGGRMDGGMGMLAHLDRLEERGYDVSAIRAAVESGDAETAHALMRQFMEEHKDGFSAGPAAGERCFNPTNHLDRLEEQGYDVSAIRAAVESGDAETSRALMQQFMEEHKDELPARPMTGGFAKQAGGHRNAAD